MEALETEDTGQSEIHSEENMKGTQWIGIRILQNDEGWTDVG